MVSVGEVFSGLTDDALLVGLVVGLAVLLHVLGVEEGELAEGALAVAGLGLVAQQVVVVGLCLAPALGHKLHVEHAQAVQAQHAVRAVMFLHTRAHSPLSTLIIKALNGHTPNSSSHLSPHLSPTHSFQILACCEKTV